MFRRMWSRSPRLMNMVCELGSALAPMICAATIGALDPITCAPTMGASG